MASKPRDLVVRFLSDVQGFLRGTDQVADAMDAVVKDQDRAADAGEDAARRLARAYDRAGDQMRRDMDRTGREIRRDVADTGREAGQEFAQNLGQSLASGDSSRIVQDSLGGLIGSLALAGPVGAAVAVGSTIALAVWGAFTQKTEERRQAVLDAAQSIYDGLVEQGNTFVAEWNAGVLKAFFDPATQDAAVTNAKAAAKALGDDLGAVLAGGPDSIAEYANTANRRIKALQDQAARSSLTGDQAEELNRLGDVIYYLSQIEDGWNLAKTAADQYSRAVQQLDPRVLSALAPGSYGAGQVPGNYSRQGRG